MTKPGNKNKLTNAAMLVAAVTLAACGREEPLSRGAASAPQIQVSAVEDVGDTTLPTAVERRHFAIYSTYRLLFNDSAHVFDARTSDQEDGRWQAVTTAASDISACSMWTTLLPD